MNQITQIKSLPSGNAKNLMKSYTGQVIVTNFWFKEKFYAKRNRPD